MQDYRHSGPDTATSFLLPGRGDSTQHPRLSLTPIRLSLTPTPLLPGSYPPPPLYSLLSPVLFCFFFLFFHLFPLLSFLSFPFFPLLISPFPFSFFPTAGQFYRQYPYRWGGGGVSHPHTPN